MKALIVVVALCAVSVLSSCGSNWTISGNEINITRCLTDTVVPAGTVILNIDDVK